MMENHVHYFSELRDFLKAFDGLENLNLHVCDFKVRIFFNDCLILYTCYLCKSNSYIDRSYVLLLIIIFNLEWWCRVSFCRKILQRRSRHQCLGSSFLGCTCRILQDYAEIKAFMTWMATTCWYPRPPLI